MCGTPAWSWWGSVYSLMSSARLNLEVGVGEEGPVRAGGDAHLERVVQVVGQHGDDLGEGHRAPLVELDHLALLLALARAVLAAAEHEDEAVVALQVRQAMQVAVLVGQLEVGQGHAGLEVLAHGLLLGMHARDVQADAVDARECGDVQRAAIGVAPRQVVRVLGEAQEAEALAGRAR